MSLQPPVPGRVRTWLGTTMMMKLERYNEEDDDKNDHDEAALYL